MKQDVVSPEGALQRTLGPLSLFAMGFGQIVGVGWIMITGKWLTAAGPVGTVMALLVGGVVMALVALCYGSVASRIPRTGAEIAYAYKALGLPVAYMAGCLVLLFAVSVVAFLTISFPWIVETFAPALQMQSAYTILGESVSYSSLIIGLLGVLIVALTSYFGVRTAAWVQDSMTCLLLILGVAVIASGH
jgi:basic amino acid/polyamine antiporter, APA family